MDKLITITKTETQRFAPDTVTVSLAACGEAKKYGQAVEAAETAAQKALAALNGSAEVKALGVDVSTVRENKRITGYRACKRFCAVFALGDGLGNALDVLEKTECEWSVGFSLKDRTEKSRALAQKAVKSAEADAKALCEAAGIELGKLCSIEYSPSEGGRPMFMRASAAGDVEPNDITLSETVVCVWEIVG